VRFGCFDHIAIFFLIAGTYTFTMGVLTWAAAGEGRMDAVFALLGGLAGMALFAQLHETLIPVLYDPTNVGQIILTDLLGNYAAAVAVLASVSACVPGASESCGDRADRSLPSKGGAIRKHHPGNAENG